MLYREQVRKRGYLLRSLYRQPVTMNVLPLPTCDLFECSLGGKWGRAWEKSPAIESQIVHEGIYSHGQIGKTRFAQLHTDGGGNEVQGIGNGERAFSSELTLTRKTGQREDLCLLGNSCARARARQSSNDKVYRLFYGWQDASFT